MKRRPAIVGLGGLFGRQGFLGRWYWWEPMRKAWGHYAGLFRYRPELRYMRGRDENKVSR